MSSFRATGPGSAPPAPASALGCDMLRPSLDLQGAAVSLHSTAAAKLGRAGCPPPLGPGEQGRHLQRLRSQLPTPSASAIRSQLKAKGHKGSRLESFASLLPARCQHSFLKSRYIYTAHPSLFEFQLRLGRAAFAVARMELTSSVNSSPGSALSKEMPTAKFPR